MNTAETKNHAWTEICQKRLTFGGLDTPAFCYDESQILHATKVLKEIGNHIDCKILFAIKSFSFFDALRLIKPFVNGFSVSSLFEAMLARDVLEEHEAVHITTPYLKKSDILKISNICKYITFNSLSQWGQLNHLLPSSASCGIRVNPQLSFVEDDRYNPCRKNSKLGVPIQTMMETLKSVPEVLRGIEGLHFHTNCDSSNFSELLTTVNLLDTHLSIFLHQVKWVNVGGGYLFDESRNIEAFSEAVRLLRSKYEVEVFVEPGAAISRAAGYLITTVSDLIESEGKIVAVLDTTVNHWPEVFEYQFEPDVVGHIDGGRYEYILAGSSCLAGDIFGEYAFEEPLEIGSRIIFANAGAYSLVKAHMFNGINLPTIYALTESGELIMKKRFTYADFADRCGVERNAAI